jgi:hypothetical protein
MSSQMARQHAMGNLLLDLRYRDGLNSLSDTNFVQGVKTRGNLTRSAKSSGELPSPIPTLDRTLCASPRRSSLCYPFVWCALGFIPSSPSPPIFLAVFSAAGMRSPGARADGKPKEAVAVKYAQKGNIDFHDKIIIHVDSNFSPIEFLVENGSGAEVGRFDARKCD